MKHRTLGLVAFLLLCGSGVTRAAAQNVASSFDQLVVLVEPGDTITVVDTAGRETRGRIEQVSRDTLTLVTPAGTQRFGEADVRTISQRRGDSLLNGAVIGAVAGTAYFVTAAMLLSDSDGGEVIVSTAVAGGVLFAGMGAAAGAGIDALISRQRVIYQSRGRNTVKLLPIVGHRRRGAALMLKF